MFKKLKSACGNFFHAYRTEVSTDKKMATNEIVAVGMIEFGHNAQSVIIKEYYMIFLMTALGIPATTIGVMFATITIIEGIRNPLLYLLLDSTNSRWGRFRPYLIIAAPLSALLSILFFCNPFPEGAISEMTVWTYISYLLWTTVNIISITAWDGLQKCITRNEDEKKKFFSLGKALNVVSGMIPSAMPIIIDLADNYNWNLRTVFVVMGIAFGIIGMLAVSRARLIQERTVVFKRPNPFKNLKYAFKNKYVLLFWTEKLPNILVNIAVAIESYFYLNCFGAYTYQTIVWTCAGIGAWAGLFFSQKIFKRLTHKQIVITYNTMINVGLIVAWFFGYQSIVPFVIINFCTHVLEYVSVVSKSVVNTNIQDYGEWKFGVRTEMSCSLAGSFIGTIFGAIDKLLLGVVCAAIGLVEGGNGRNQTAETTQWLFFIYLMVGGVGGLLAMVPWLFYDLTPKKVDFIRKELEARKEQHRLKELGVLNSDEAKVESAQFKFYETHNPKLKRNPFD